MHFLQHSQDTYHPVSSFHLLIMFLNDEPRDFLQILINNLLFRVVTRAGLPVLFAANSVLLLLSKFLIIS